MRKIMIMLLCGVLARNIYAMPCYVSEIDTESDIVCFTDYATGNDWWQDGQEDWHEGDGANLVMFDSMTENYMDDAIIRAFPVEN